MESTTTDGSLNDVAVGKLGEHAKDRGSSSFWVGDYQRGYRWGPDEARDLLARRQPNHRLVDPGEVAQTILLCVENGAINGQGINIDGGAVQS